MADKRKYIIATFLEACSNSKHHHHWMDADTWAKVIAVQYNLNDAVKFSGADIAKGSNMEWKNNSPADGIVSRLYL